MQSKVTENNLRNKVWQYLVFYNKYFFDKIIGVRYSEKNRTMSYKFRSYIILCVFSSAELALQMITTEKKSSDQS